MCKCKVISINISHFYFYLYYSRVLIGEVDNEIDSRLNLAEIRAEPLAQINH